MTVSVDTLRAMRALLTPPGAWAPGVTACDAQNNRVAPASDRAVSWCLYGAAMRLSGDNITLRDVLGIPDVVAWNDRPERTQADVLALLDAAIERLST